MNSNTNSLKPDKGFRTQDLPFSAFLHATRKLYPARGFFG
jgi:hypothetical protein